MDITSLYYFSELAKDLHMTRTASRLFISQQTLSNHIQRLEEHYGTQLLTRKPTMSLTCAGEFVLGFANLINKESANLTDILSDIERQERGVIKFGASPLRINACLPNVLSAFSERYPNVELRVTDAISSKLEPLVLSGELDFAVVLLGEPHSSLVDMPLMNEQVYLCVSDSLLNKYYPNEAALIKKKSIAGAQAVDFSRLPFCIQSSRLGLQIKECFDEKGITPKTYISSSDTQISTSLCFKGLAACFVTQMRLIVHSAEIPADINIFPVIYRDRLLTQRLSLIRRKDRYLTHYSKLFLDLVFEYFSKIDQIKLERAV